MPTSYEIYQTYLRSPAAIIRLFEQSLGTQGIYERPEPDMQQRTIEGCVAGITWRRVKLRGVFLPATLPRLVVCRVRAG
jgi:hypothetical protein